MTNNEISTGHIHVLVVDDDAAICELCSEMLTGYGFSVDTAEDGAAAWQALKLKNYDLLITDNVMPKISGIELLKKIYDAQLNLPAILATGKLADEFAGEPWFQPVVVLRKPYSFEELFEAVNKVLPVPHGF